MVFSLSFSALAADYRYFYVLRRDELVSNVLYRAGLKPIYRKDGTLLQISKINGQIKDIDEVQPGTKIFFSDELAERSLGLGLIRINKNNEIIVLNALSSPKLAQANPIPRSAE
ncbi:MAG: hypothetical protein EOP09_17665, partial [Proteobacteria bacterium]